MAEFCNYARKVDEQVLSVRRVICSLLMHNLDAIGRGIVGMQLTELLAELESLESHATDLPSVLHQNVNTTIRWFEECFPEFHQTHLACTSTAALVAPSELSETVYESWLLFYTALVSRGISEKLFGQLMSKKFYNSVYLAVRRYGHYLRVATSPVPQHLIQYVTKRSPTTAPDAAEEFYLQKLINPSTYRTDSDLEELLNDKLLLITELSALQNNTDSIARSAGLSADSVFRLSARDCQCICLVLLPHTTRSTEHSCLSNVQVGVCTSTAVREGQSARVELPALQRVSSELSRTATLGCMPVVELTATRLIDSSSSGLLLNYVEDIASEGVEKYNWRERQTALQTRFQLPTARGDETGACACVRCRYEEACSGCQSAGVSPVVDAIDSRDLLALGHVYMQQSQFTAAIRAYESVLRRFLGDAFNADDGDQLQLGAACATARQLSAEQHKELGDAFHALGAAHLEGGDWRRGRALWRTGSTLCADHKQLRAEVAKVDCFADVTVATTRAGPTQKLPASECEQLYTKTILRRRSSTIAEVELYGEQQHGTDYHLVGGSAPSHTSLPAYLRIHHPHTSTGAHLTAPSQRILDVQECDWIIRATEAFAAHSGGWTTSRHYAVPTTDIPVHVIQSTARLGASAGAQLPVLEWFNALFRDRLAPLLATQFQGAVCTCRLSVPFVTASFCAHLNSAGDFKTGAPIHVAVHDAFVVKYDAGVPMLGAEQSGSAPAPTGQTYLPLHCDQSSHSFTVALNSCDEYDGGGTYIPSFGSVYRPGMALCTLRFSFH
jgi:hypothetical protein